MVEKFMESYHLLMDDSLHLISTGEEFKSRALNLYFDLIDNYKLIDECYNATRISNNLNNYLSKYGI